MNAAEYPMIPVEEALEIVLRETGAPLAPRRVVLEDALGLVTAQAVRAADPLPPFAASIKDGYAVVAADGAGDFPLAGEVTAGRTADFVLQAGQVAYITTGAPVPSGADAVVQVEDTERLPAQNGRAQVRIGKGATPGQDIRPIGFDVQAGAVVIDAGERVGPAEIGLAATVGVTDLLVYPRPRVGVLSTGDELLAAGDPLRPGAIRDSNGPTLRAAVALAGGIPVDLGIAPDDEEPLRAVVAEGLRTCDILLTTGGVSMGELDLLKKLAEEGGTVHFGRLRMKPGKPCTFATFAGNDGRSRLLFALPGNPVSSLVTFYLLALPAIRRLAGWRTPTLPHVQAVTGVDLRLDPYRPEYHRAHLEWDRTLHNGAGGWRASSTGNQASSRLLSMRGANALLLLPQAEGLLPAGSVVDAYLIA